MVHISYNFNETCVDLMSCTCMFLSFHTQLHSLFITLVYRTTHVFTISLRVKFYLYTHTAAKPNQIKVPIK